MTRNRSAEQVEGERHPWATSAGQVEDGWTAAGLEAAYGEPGCVDGALDERRARNTDCNVGHDSASACRIGTTS